ncbi:hypothetical protein ES703_53606 [subsurface metagenome]
MIFLTMSWIVLAMLGGVIEGAFLGTGAGTEQGVLNTLASSPIMTSTSIWGKIAGVFTDGAFWGALAKMFTFDFAMFEGGTEIFRWIFFLPIAISIGVSLILAFVRGVGSS